MLERLGKRIRREEVPNFRSGHWILRRNNSLSHTPLFDKAMFCQKPNASVETSTLSVLTTRDILILKKPHFDSVSFRIIWRRPEYRYESTERTFPKITVIIIIIIRAGVAQSV